MKNAKLVMILVIVSIILLFLWSPVLLLKNGPKRNVEYDNLPEEVVIKQYEPGTGIRIKEVNIYSKEKIEELSRYVSKLKPLEEHEMINLALLQEIDIIYNDSITIGVQLDEEGYCYYENKDKNISSLSKMPRGLVDWIKDNLKLEG